MNPIFLSVVAASAAAAKRARARRRAAASRRHVGFFAWLRRWFRRRSARDDA